MMSLLFNTLSSFVIALLPRSNCLLISWLQSPSEVILEPKKRNSVTASKFPPSIYHEVMGPDDMILIFLILSFKLTFSLSSFTLIRSSLVLQFLPLAVILIIPADCCCFQVHPRDRACFAQLSSESDQVVTILLNRSFYREW